MQNNSTSESIILTIITKHGKILDNQKVFAVSAINQKGLFDILPEHENFISIIKDKVIIHKTRDQKQELNIDKGVLKAANNKVEIFLGIS